jgi:hypothetical protein
MIEESPEFLHTKLWEMDRAIVNIDSINGKHAYTIAKSLSSNYVTGIRLQFLRAESYNPEKAAERCLRFLETKLEIWGQARLAKSLDLSDFSSEDMDAFKSGYAMLLDEKDRSGRAVLYMGVPENISLESRVRWWRHFFV